MDEAVLALGGTSLIGRFLLPLAAERGLEIAALSRRAPAEASAGARWVEGDLGAGDLAERLPPVATVLSCSPIWLLPQALEALHARGMRRLVAFSSTSRFVKYDSPEPKERETARSLAESEATVAAFCDAHGIGWTILRPTLIYAEGQDGNVSRLARLIRRLHVLPLSGTGAGLRQPVHAADLAWAALEVCARPGTAGRDYNLPGGETLSYRAMSERVFEGLGLKPRLVSVPQPLWRMAFRVAAPLLPGASASMGDRMAADLTFDPEPARRDFGWSPRPFRPQFRGVV